MRIGNFVIDVKDCIVILCVGATLIVGFVLWIKEQSNAVKTMNEIEKMEEESRKWKEDHPED